MVNKVSLYKKKNRFLNLKHCFWERTNNLFCLLTGSQTRTYENDKASWVVLALSPPVIPPWAEVGGVEVRLLWEQISPLHSSGLPPQLEVFDPTHANTKMIKFRPFRWTKDDFARFYLSGRATAKSLKQYYDIWKLKSSFILLWSVQTFTGIKKNIYSVLFIFNYSFLRSP